MTGSLRLENVACHPQKPAAENAIEGRIVNRLFKGSRTSVDIRVGEGALLKAYLEPEAAARVHRGLVRRWHAGRCQNLAGAGQ